MCVEDKASWNYQRGQSEQFPKQGIDQGMSKHAIEYFTEQQRKFKIWVECPSKFEKPPEEPLALARQTRVFNAGSCVDGRFGDDPHTAWESYQRTMSTSPYKTIMSNSLYPKRARVASEMDHATELASWERQTSTEALQKRNKGLKNFRETVY